MADDPNSSLLAPEAQVLSTMQRDGRRRWLTPRLAPGRFLTWRRAVAWGLIAIFTALPYLTLNGKPAVLLNVIDRRFTILGFTFLPTDTTLLAIFLLLMFMVIFFATAMFGRVWCGWACPQTVYLEFVYRPIERLCTGRRGIGGRPRGGLPGWRRALMHGLFLLVSLFLAHTFLSYFVGVANLRQWIFGSPWNHPVAFAVVMATTGLMMFDFAFWREQMCIIGCPYGRLQSVLLDRASLIIGYDRHRGEPRSRFSRKARAETEAVPLTVGASDRGDCIDCTMCVQVCPTGIDIRDGLQMECVGCAQCIDACDTVMRRIGRPTGLIRYSSQAAIEGKTGRLLRPRTVIYPVLVLGLAAVFATLLINRAAADVTVLRQHGLPALVQPDGRVLNSLRIKIVNRTDGTRRYQLAVAEPDGVEIRTSGRAITIQPAGMFTEPIQLIAAPGLFRGGRLPATVQVTDDLGNTLTEPALLLYSGAPVTRPGPTDAP